MRGKYNKQAVIRKVSRPVLLCDAKALGIYVLYWNNQKSQDPFPGYTKKRKVFDEYENG